MNRLDPVSGMLVTRSGRSSSPEILRSITWAIFALAAILAIFLGIYFAYNFQDRLAQTLSEVSLTILIVDFWALGLSLFRRTARTPLRIPIRTPLVLAPLHLALWYWSRYLISFDVFYRLEPIDELAGIYTMKWEVFLLLLVLSSVSVVSAVFQTRLVGWVLLSENTAVPEDPPIRDPGSEPDMPAGPEHIYEAQVILNHLGYEMGGIDGKVSETTRTAVKDFQESCGLDPSGEVTILTIIELRNRWAGEESPPPGQSVKAISGHIVKRLISRATTFWQKRKNS
jgi:hypothetical protein